MLSCEKENNFEILLTDKTKKWVYIDNPTFNKNSIISTYIKFEKNNTCSNYNISDDTKKYSGSDEWEYSEKDSSFIVFENKFKFIKVRGDSIYVKYKDENFIALFMNIGNNKNIIKGNKIIFNKE